MSSPWLLHSPFRRELLRLLMTHAHNKEHHPTDLIYIYACHESEQALCHLELQRLLGTTVPPEQAYLRSSRLIDPSRSPFMKLRLEVIAENKEYDGLLADIDSHAIQVPQDRTFKVVYIKEGVHCPYDEQRKLERRAGECITGTARMKDPDITYGLMQLENTWVFGIVRYAEPIWLQHKNKPYNYSTGLSSRIARAIVNVAAPEGEKVSMMDPCCGMGNVLIEALSMGIKIRGNDLNPLAIRGARVNLEHYGYDASLVTLGDMNELTGHADRAVLDLPYNLCSVLSMEEQLGMLRSLGRLADEAVIISTEPLEEQLNRSGWRIQHHIQVTKGSFTRDIWLCEHQG